MAAAAAAPALLMPRLALGATAFPSRSIQFIIPYAAGGGFDTFVRYVAPVMEAHLPNKVTIVPFNIATGGGMRGITQLYRSRPDGHTIGIVDMPGMFVQQAVHGANGYDMAKFSWVGCMGEGERYLVGVGMNSPLKTFDDLKALSAQRPVKFAVTGLDGTATAACIIGTELLGVRRQLITGYRGSSEFIVAAIRGDFGCGHLRDVDDDEVRARQSDPHHCVVRDEVEHPGHSRRDRARQTRARCDHRRTADRRTARNADRDPGHPVGWRSQKPWPNPRLQTWAKDNDITMRSKTPQKRCNWSRDSAHFSRSGETF